MVFAVLRLDHVLPIGLANHKDSPGSLGFQLVPGHKILVYKRTRHHKDPQHEGRRGKGSKVFEARTDGLIYRTATHKPLMLFEAKAGARNLRNKSSARIRDQEAAQQGGLIDELSLPRDRRPAPQKYKTISLAGKRTNLFISAATPNKRTWNITWLDDSFKSYPLTSANDVVWGGRRQRP